MIKPQNICDLPDIKRDPNSVKIEVKDEPLDPSEVNEDSKHLPQCDVIIKVKEEPTEESLGM